MFPKHLHMIRPVDALKEDNIVDQNNISLSMSEWQYLFSSSHMFYKLIDFSHLYNWSTTKIGTFFVKALPYFAKENSMSMSKSKVSWGLKYLHQLFTIPASQEVSLIDIGGKHHQDNINVVFLMSSTTTLLLVTH